MQREIRNWQLNGGEVNNKSNQMNTFQFPSWMTEKQRDAQHLGALIGVRLDSETRISHSLTLAVLDQRPITDKDLLSAEESVHAMIMAGRKNGRVILRSEYINSLRSTSAKWQHTLMKLIPLGPNCNEVVVGDVTILFSYQTPVAMHVTGELPKVSSTFYSRTTSKHIGQWKRRHGFENYQEISAEELAKCVKPLA